MKIRQQKKEKKISKIYSLILISIISLIQAQEIFAKNNSPQKELALKDKIITPVITSGFADIIEQVMPSVVNISAIQDSETLSSNAISEILQNQAEDHSNSIDFSKSNNKKKLSSIGSGIIISKDGYIITSSHVVVNSQDIKVTLNNNMKYQAKVIGIDKLTDLALIKIDAKKDLNFVKFGDSKKARIGDWVVVVGNPYGLGGSVSIGIISARSRDINNGQIDDFIQTDAAINKGNSGGPLFNLKGEVIGINTAIFSPSGGNVGIGFATPSSIVIEVARQLKESGEVSRGYLGISITEVNQEIAEINKMERIYGALVSEVDETGPAAEASILTNDIIIKFDNQEISDVKTLPKIVAKSEIGKVFDLELIRAGQLKKIKIRVAKMKIDDSEEKIKKISNEKKIIEKPSEINKNRVVRRNFFGIILSEISPNDQKLFVSSITKNAKNKDLKVNDLIISANQKKIENFSDLISVINQAKQGSKKIFLLIKRGEKNIVSTIILN
jgi:serine protease Do